MICALTFTLALFLSSSPNEETSPRVPNPNSLSSLRLPRLELGRKQLRGHSHARLSLPRLVMKHAKNKCFNAESTIQQLMTLVNHTAALKVLEKVEQDYAEKLKRSAHVVQKGDLFYMPQVRVRTGLQLILGTPLGVIEMTMLIFPYEVKPNAGKIVIATIALLIGNCIHNKYSDKSFKVLKSYINFVNVSFLISLAKNPAFGYYNVAKIKWVDSILDIKED
ncbi:hypothetical protein L484_025817 [Morus notabilis]|uniref:Uncharacterized protein n=1 Tax=Morus notabilis TaxID=981085 RepID=W9R2D4_9ROSA|nr:hypothetical protein L484_025817 [Morus notabilis]